jgi:uncharacterized protein (TIGR03000 family)
MHMLKFFAPTAVVAVAIALTTPGTSDAHWRSYGYGWGGHGYRSGWYTGYNYGPGYCYSYAPYYGYTYPVTYVYPVQGYVNIPELPANTASIRVTVPADAKVWFDDRKTTQTGSERLFESPPLAPGSDYSYDIKVQWRDRDGKEMTQTRRVHVSANASISVDFRPLAGE